MTRLRVLVADDHALFLFAIAQSVQLRPELELAGQATTGRHAVALALELRPDLAGLEVLKAINREGLATRVLFLSTSLRPAIAYDLVEAGAAGVLSKDVT